MTFEFFRPVSNPSTATILKPMELEVTAAIETYSSECNENLYNNDFSDFSVPSSRQRGQGQQYDNTPTNAEMSLLKKACDGDSSDLSSDLESLYPSVPLRFVPFNRNHTLFIFIPFSATFE